MMQIIGFSTSDKRPGFVGETVLGAGAISQGSAPNKVLCCGLKHPSLGTMTANVTIAQAFSEDDCDTLAGAGSELALMGKYALGGVEGASVWLAAPAAVGGAVAATGTIQIAGTWSTTGEWGYYVNGIKYTGGISATNTIQQVANAIAAAINADLNCPFVAVVGAGATYIVTLTCKVLTVRGNDYILDEDESKLPTGCTSAIAGGASVTGGGVKFASGAGVETMTTMLTALYPGWYHRIAAAQNDATSVAAWRTQINAKAGPLEGRTEHIVFGHNGTYSAATSLSSSTLNNGRAQVAWLLNSETHPAFIAATLASLRSVTENEDPAAMYDGAVLLGITPQRFEADRSLRSVEVSALDLGLTPLATTDDGFVTVVRSIGTHCLNGSDPDYRTLDTSDSVVPDYVRNGLRLIWTTEFVVANKRVAPDPADDERDRKAGVATPKRWSDRITKYLFELENRTILIDVASNLPISEFNTTAKRIMSAVTTIPAYGNHQVGVSVRQRAA